MRRQKLAEWDGVVALLLGRSNLEKNQLKKTGPDGWADLSNPLVSVLELYHLRYRSPSSMASGAV